MEKGSTPRRHQPASDDSAPLPPHAMLPARCVVFVFPLLSHGWGAVAASPAPDSNFSTLTLGSGGTSFFHGGVRCHVLPSGPGDPQRLHEGAHCFPCSCSMRHWICVRAPLPLAYVVRAAAWRAHACMVLTSAWHLQSVSWFAFAPVPLLSRAWMFARAGVRVPVVPCSTGI